jgi:hypothetical protein
MCPVPTLPYEIPLSARPLRSAITGKCRSTYGITSSVNIDAQRGGGPS